MIAITFDTLKSAENLIAAGFTPAQAKAIVETEKDAFQERLDSGLATKEDVQSLNAATQKDIQSLREETKKDIQSLREETKRDFQSLREETKESIWQLREEMNKRLMPIERKLLVHDWMLGFVLFFQVTILLKLFL